MKRVAKKYVDLDLLRPANRHSDKKRKNAEPPHFVEMCACEARAARKTGQHVRSHPRMPLKAASSMHQIKFICFFTFYLVLLGILLQN